MTLAAVADLLRCPHCPAEARLSPDDPDQPHTLRCPAGHTFDVARQGHLNLLGRAQPRNADTAAMIEARERFHGSGAFDGVTRTLTALVPATATTVVDVGAGPGRQLGVIVAAGPGRRGLALDVSVAACRRAARVHPRVGSVVADGWQVLPVGSGTTDVVVSAFAPRNGVEFARLLSPAGRLITVTPLAEHLLELRERLDLLRVDPDKDRRLAAGLDGFEVEQADEVVERSGWTADQARWAVAMGPNAFHADTDLRERRLAAQPWPLPVTVACRITRWRPR